MAVEVYDLAEVDSGTALDALLGKARSAVQPVTTLSQLPESGTNGASVSVLGFHEAGDGGGGEFYWDATRPKSEHNGGTIIDPGKLDQLADWPGTWFVAAESGVGCWVRKNVTFINPRWFGAFGNGIYDDTLSIQASDIFGIIKIPHECILRTTHRVQIDNASSIIGSGMSSGFHFDHNERGGLFFENREGICLADFFAYGTATNDALVGGRAAIQLVGVKEARISNVQIKDSNVSGITIGDLCSNVCISNASVIGAFEHCIYISGGANNVALSNLILSDSGINGTYGNHIKIARSSNIVISGAICNGDGGVLIDQNIDDSSVCENIYLSNCNITNTQALGYGLRIRNRCKDIFIQSSSFIGPSGGISIDNVDPENRYPENIIINNVIAKCESGASVEINDVRGFSISDLVVRNSSAGIYQVIINENCVNGTLRGIATEGSGPGVRISSPSVRYIDGRHSGALPVVQYTNMPIIISSGVISVFCSNAVIDTEELSSEDDLVTIYGGYEGSIIAIRIKDASRIVRVQSTGNIRIRPISPFVLDNIHKQLFLMYSDGIWRNVSV